MTHRLRIGLDAAAFALALWAVSPAPRACAQPSSDRFDQRAMFRVVGAMYGLDPDLLAAIARVESGGQPGAVSRAGAMGLMQLMPATAARYRVVDPFDPVQNALGAARFIAQMRSAGSCALETQWSVAQMLAAYNAGEDAVCRYGGIPPYPETREYVGRVLWIYLLGVSPTRHTKEHRTANSSSKPATDGHLGEIVILEELDSLRRARASAALSDCQSK